MQVQDLSFVVSKTEYNEFLRDFFHIDSRQLIKRLHMYLLTYPNRFAVDAEKGSVRFVTPNELSDLKYSVEDRACEFLLLWYAYFSIHRSLQVQNAISNSPLLSLSAHTPAFPCSRIF